MGKNSKLPCHILGKSANLTQDKTFLTVSNRFVSSLYSPFVIFQNTEQFLWHLFHFFMIFYATSPTTVTQQQRQEICSTCFLGLIFGESSNKLHHLCNPPPSYVVLILSFFFISCLSCTFYVCSRIMFAQYQ